MLHFYWLYLQGGKGRTGTMVCVWLVECGAFEDAETSLEYFGQRRTDTNVGTKFQVRLYDIKVGGLGTIPVYQVLFIKLLT